MLGNSSIRLQRHFLQRRQAPPGVFLVARRTLAKKKTVTVNASKKKQSSAAASAASSAETGRDKNLELILASLDGTERVEAELSADEKARRYEIGRNHVIGRFLQHNEINHDLTCKIHLKKHAVKMLPRNSQIKEEAMKTDGEGPPVWRHIARWTAPIPNFDPSLFAEHEED